MFLDVISPLNNLSTSSISAVVIFLLKIPFKFLTGTEYGLSPAVVNLPSKSKPVTYELSGATSLKTNSSLLFLANSAL